ncbi:MAG: HDOD domain-containing protein [Desulfobacterales bacterium]|jgi:HD-like signal output (HDOD) protein
MSNTKINEILDKVKSFPTIPGAGTRMLSLLEEPDASVSEIEDILRYDPGLTANILCQTPDTSGPTAGNDVELSQAVIDRVGIQLDQLESISEKVVHWVNELSSASAFN